MDRCLQLCVPLGNYFLNRHAAGMTESEFHLATFLLELTLQNFSFTHLPCSLVAAGAINLAGAICGRLLWVTNRPSSPVIFVCWTLVVHDLLDVPFASSSLALCWSAPPPFSIEAHLGTRHVRVAPSLRFHRLCVRRIRP